MNRTAAEALLSDISDPRVRDAFLHVDRAEFVRPNDRDYAWSDCALQIDYGAKISQPSLVAYMTEKLDLQPDHRVLEIGTGSGYQSAILARLAKEVFSVEVHPQLAAQAKERLDSMQLENVELRCADGRKGWPEKALLARRLQSMWVL